MGNFVMDASKYEFSLNHFSVESLNVDLVQSFFYMLPITKYDFCQHFLINGCLQKGDDQGKIFIDRINKNFFLNKFKFSGKVIKMGAEVFDLIVDTITSPYHIDVLYPQYFQKMFIMLLLELNVPLNSSQIMRTWSWISSVSQHS